MEYTLIANSGIQMLTFRMSIDMQDKFKMLFHEWYDEDKNLWQLELLHDLVIDDTQYSYDKKQLFNAGYLIDPNIEFDVDELRQDDIRPLSIDGDLCDGVSGEIYKLTFADKNNMLSHFENKWLPIPYFFKRTEHKFKFSPMNWSRVKLIPRSEKGSKKEYDVLLAFDTRAGYESNAYNEFPVFPDQYCSEMIFELCSQEFFLMDYCSPNEKWSYIEEYLFKLVYPQYTNLQQIRGLRTKRMSYVASYVFLINYLAQNGMFPKIKFYKDKDVEIRDVDMVIDIGNSRTTALLIEDNSNFNQVKPLSLVDFSQIIVEDKKTGKTKIHSYNEPFDMRLAFRNVDFGSFGITDSKQFVYPSFVRLGQEAASLIHKACDSAAQESTYSSPKRYLWDDKPSKKEWEFLVLPGESKSHILNVKGLSSYLRSDGRVDLTGTEGGRSSYYSRRTLMTFAFLEMIVQAESQINSEKYRKDYGWLTAPRKISRIIVTCPTAMSKVEREALIHCAKDAVALSRKFKGVDAKDTIEVVPSFRSMRDEEGAWYYDEATCAQLVYVYGEIGYKYKGVCSEFFNLYGKKLAGQSQPTLTVASFDIGAGTSDLMISQYSYEKGDVTEVIPDPKFYDSFYFAGDDMLKALIKNVMLLDDKQSAFRQALKDMQQPEYFQLIKNYFGPDHNGQTIEDRNARKDFNIQYSIPLMTYFLGLASSGSENCPVKFNDVFKENKPNDRVVAHFKEKTGIDITTLVWEYNKEYVEHIITQEFEPLFKKVAAMMYAYSCDVILLSGRPASLPAIRNIFLKYYPVSPNRLISLNNYYVGDWYPFGNNTGYITNPKTIVAMGGVIAHYASEYSTLDKFTIKLDKLRTNLKSTINYIEATRDGQPIEYLITPEKLMSDLVITKLPTSLNVRQFGLESYPSRALYSIDFNFVKLTEKIRKQAQAQGLYLTDSAILAQANKEVSSYRARMPFKVTIERDVEDKEQLYITNIEDRYGASLADTSIEIHIQSLGVDDSYWLDSGVFEF